MSLRSYTRINLKVLFVIVVVLVLVVVSLFTARHVRRRVLSARDKAAGKAAYASRDWSAAFKHYAEYLGRNLDDTEIIKEYANAAISIQPVTLEMLERAIASYRRVLQLKPDVGEANDEVYDKLVCIYSYIGNYNELIYLARQKLDKSPKDSKARLWLVDALIATNKQDQAREELAAFIADMEVLPSKPEEYTLALLRMSQLVREQSSQSDITNAMSWLNQAIAHAPNSIEVHLMRARFYRESFPVDEGSYAINRDRIYAELQVMDTLEPWPVELVLAIGAEWLALGEYQKVTEILAKAETYSQDTVVDRFLDLNHWLIGKYSLASELALQQKQFDLAVVLTDQLLDQLKENRYRISVLPTAVNCYMMGGATNRAHESINEFENLVLEAGSNASSKGLKDQLDYLEALMASKENKHNLVISLLKPYSVNMNVSPNIWRLLAISYVQTGMYQQGGNALENYLRFYPNDIDMLEQLARIYHVNGDFDKAGTVIEHAHSIDPNCVSTNIVRLLVEIQKLSQQPETERIDGLQRVSKDLDGWVEIYPERADLRILQANLALQQGNQDQAEQILKGAIAECDSPLDAEMRLIGLYLQTNCMVQAIQVSRTACERHADLAAPWIAQAVCFQCNREYENAMICLRNGLSKVTDDQQKHRLILELATLELSKGERSTGIDLLKKLAEQDKDEIQARVHLLELPEIQADTDAVSRLIAELRQAEGQGGLLWRYWQARQWLYGNDWREYELDIVDYLRPLVNDNSEWMAPILALIDLYELRRDVDAVEKLCRQVLTRNPRAKPVAARLMLLLERQSRLEEADRVVAQFDMGEDYERNWRIQMAIQKGDLTTATEGLHAQIEANQLDVPSHLLLARLVYRQTKDVEKAFEYIRQAEAIDPNATNIVAAKITILDAEGRQAEAKRLLQEHVQAVKTYDAYLLSATYNVHFGDPRVAENDYLKLLTFEGRGSLAYLLLADYYQKYIEIDRMIDTLQEGLEIYPEDLQLTRRLLQGLVRRGTMDDLDRVRSMLASLLEQQPNNPVWLQMEASLIMTEGSRQSIEEAGNLLEQVVHLDPTAVQAQIVLINMDLQNGDIEQAQIRVVQALGANPDNVFLMALHARVELLLGNMSMAVGQAYQVLDKKPDQAAVLDSLALVAIRSKNLELNRDVQIHLETVLKNDPDSQVFRLLKTALLKAQGNYDTAIVELETYTQTDVGRSAFGALVELAHLYLRVGNPDAAQPVMEWAEELNPTSPALLQVRIDWVSLLQQDGQTERAEKIFQELIKKYPKNIQLLNNYAWLLQDCYQRYDAALDLANRGLAIRPDDLNLLDTRGVILSKIEGKMGDAKKDFSRLVEISPRNSSYHVKSLAQLGRICAQLKEANQAGQYLRQTLDLDEQVKVLSHTERQEIKELLKNL